MARVILIVGTLVTSWLWMQIVHEFGHVLGAWSTGGTVERVVLHPLAISRTDVSAAQHPLVVIWAGPILGCLLPVLMWLLSKWLKWHSEFLYRFFAGFCLLANGAYLAGGSFDGIGDCGDLLRHGSPIWTLWLFGLVTIPAGLLLWHEQGRHFGLGPRRLPVDARLAYTVAVIAGLTAVMEVATS
ncbi:M50 family metallopeptidase [Anatilimnocola sp. NA78]|uniref:M50 family metallopeptidase n=1 Tax=Anatilimnocola sp. NA78 TaxID=3415683 RepID=UPI003CE54E65